MNPEKKTESEKKECPEWKRWLETGSEYKEDPSFKLDKDGYIQITVDPRELPWLDPKRHTRYTLPVQLQLGHSRWWCPNLSDWKTRNNTCSPGSYRLQSYKLDSCQLPTEKRHLIDQAFQLWIHHDYQHGYSASDVKELFRQQRNWIFECLERLRNPQRYISACPSIRRRHQTNHEPVECSVWKAWIEEMQDAGIQSDNFRLTSSGWIFDSGTMGLSPVALHIQHVCQQPCTKETLSFSIDDCRFAWMDAGYAFYRPRPYDILFRSCLLSRTRRFVKHYKDQIHKASYISLRNISKYVLGQLMHYERIRSPGINHRPVQKGMLSDMDELEQLEDGWLVLHHEIGASPLEFKYQHLRFHSGTEYDYAIVAFRERDTIDPGFWGVTDDGYQRYLLSDKPYVQAAIRQFLSRSKDLRVQNMCVDHGSLKVTELDLVERILHPRKFLSKRSKRRIRKRILEQSLCSKQESC